MMKIDFSNAQCTVTKITDAILDQIITEFLLNKINSVLNPRQKRRGDYDGFRYISRHVNEWYSVGSVYYFSIIPEIPNRIETNIDIERLSTSEILNWMCAEHNIDAGEYLIKVIQVI